jgi:alanine racemase
MSRSAIAILSTEALAHNITVLKGHAPRSYIWAMVKANAYGHGLRSVSLRLEPYVDNLAVACIDEALALRRAGIKKPITLIEGINEPDELLIASCENFHVVFHDPLQLEWLYASSLPLPLTTWLKIDTGMGRLGFLGEEAEQAYEKLVASKWVKQPVGIMSHFACADIPNHSLNHKQITRFKDFIQQRSAPISFCNSAGIFSFPEQHYDVIRPGIALYGVSPIADFTATSLGLKPVMTLQTRLIAKRIIPEGSTIGYGARYICRENMPIGVIAMGYGDGLSRTTQDGAPILVNGIRCSFVGKVSMDMATIDLRNCPDAQVGDPVILWGEGLPIEEVAPFTSLSPYDMLTGIQPRVKFYWTMIPN